MLGSTVPPLRLPWAGTAGSRKENDLNVHPNPQHSRNRAILLISAVNRSAWETQPRCLCTIMTDTFGFLIKTNMNRSSGREDTQHLTRRTSPEGLSSLSLLAASVSLWTSVPSFLTRCFNQRFANNAMMNFSSSLNIYLSILLLCTTTHSSSQ